MSGIMHLSFILLLTLFSFTNFAQTTIISGSWSVNPVLAEYSLDKNNGDRNMILEIKFDKPFEKTPEIILSVSQIDADKNSNIRYKAEALSVSKEGFIIKVRTWADSRIFSISGYWFAAAD
ncbi:MAG: H-type lectin domain-containing protein [Ignavibacteriaceae bacterium]|jgi:hypothetical protein|nr:H-type lectin domain-containing protein [Ignavibacteriaceae bacterium]MEB2354914.1 H-type lectin domain-containing protein [Ignavibacteriales bacterium]GIK23473.1 MAG: hypothetical protein BroJett005_28870 [Ignavibacteriota bacterium]